MRKIKSSVLDFVIYGISLFAVIITLYPILNVIAVSFSNYSEYIKNPLMIVPKGFNLEAFKYVFSDRLLKSSYINTIFVTVATVVFGLILMMMTAYPLSLKGLKGKAVFMNYIIFTMIFSGGLIPNYYLIRSLKLLDSLWALILPSLMSAFNLILMKNFFEALPESLREAAKIDGAGEFRILFRIYAPLSMPIIATLALFIAVTQWNSFFNAVIYIRSETKWPLQLFLRELIMTTNLTTTGDLADSNRYVMPETMKYASLLIVMVPIMCVYPFLQKYFVKGVTIGAVKG